MKTELTPELITDSQALSGAKTRFGSTIRTYDDGYGPLWILRDSMEITGIIRARTWENAYGIAEDEMFPEAAETVEQLKKEHATQYVSGLELWLHKGFSRSMWQGLTADERMQWHLANPGEDVPFDGEFTEHPCFQEAYGFRPNGPNDRDSINHGIYAKDLNGDYLDRLTPALVAELGITLEMETCEN